MAPTDDDKKSDFVSVVSTAVLILGIYSYFFGWTYAYYLFDHFGISITAIEVPVYYFFVYSYAVIGEGWAGAISVSVGIVVYGLWTRFPKVAVLIVIILLLVGFHIAQEKGITRAREIRAGQAKTITFLIKKQAEELLPKEFLTANKNHALKLIVHTPERFYVLHQPYGEENAIPYGYTYLLSKEDVIAARVILQNTIKEVHK